MFKFLLLPVALMLIFVGLGTVIHQVMWTAGVGAAVFAPTAIISWARQEIARQ